MRGTTDREKVSNADSDRGWGGGERFPAINLGVFSATLSDVMKSMAAAIRISTDITSAASTLKSRVVDEVTSPFVPEIAGTRSLVHYHQS